MKAWEIFLIFALIFGIFLSYYVGFVGGFERGLLMLVISILSALLFTKLGIAFENYGKET